MGLAKVPYISKILMTSKKNRHSESEGSFVDFWVEIPVFAGDMKLIFLCFALLTHVVLLLGFRHFRVQFDLLGECRTQRGPPNVLNPSPSAISIFSTPRSTCRAFVLFLVTKFLFLELGPTGSVSCSL